MTNQNPYEAAWVEAVMLAAGAAAEHWEKGNKDDARRWLGLLHSHSYIARKHGILPAYEAILRKHWARDFLIDQRMILEEEPRDE